MIKKLITNTTLKRIGVFIAVFAVCAVFMSDKFINISDSALIYKVYAAVPNSGQATGDIFGGEDFWAIDSQKNLDDNSVGIFDYLNYENQTQPEDDQELTPDGFVYLKELPISREIQLYTYKRCQQLDIEYPLVLALMWRESRFTVTAVNYNRNGTYDSGLMQINDVNKTWLLKDHGIDNLMDPYQNIDAGTTMLANFTQKHGQHNALLAYQYGEGGMQNKLEQGINTNKQIEAALVMRDYYRSLIEYYTTLEL